MSAIQDEICYHLEAVDSYLGLGIIIVNFFKDNEKPLREGAETELDNLTRLFTMMGLQVRIHTELRADQIEDVLCSTAREESLVKYSIIAIGISSHGDEEGLFGIESNSNHVTSAKIREIFNGKNCQALATKPKILLLNGCKSTVLETSEKESLQDDFQPASIEVKAIREAIPDQKATIWSDFFIAYSCLPGSMLQHRGDNRGLFIEEFLNTYTKYGQEFSLEALMPIVNRKMIWSCINRNTSLIQSCSWESSCTCILKIPMKRTDAKMSPPKPLLRVKSLIDSFNLLWATCSRGSQGSNLMCRPSGLITTKTGHIYVSDPDSKCIWIYSKDGQRKMQHMDEDTYKQVVIRNLGLAYCWGMCVRDDSLYVSCNLAVLKFSLPDRELVNHKFFDSPIKGMDIDEDGTVYACEPSSCSILLLDSLLNVKEKIDLSSTLVAGEEFISDIKVIKDKIFILVNNSEYTVQMFDKKGGSRQKLVSRNDLNESYFFVIDPDKWNIFAGDVATNELKCFTANGQFMCSIGSHGNGRGDFAEPMGVDLNVNEEVVIVSSQKDKYMLQSFKIPLKM